MTALLAPLAYAALSVGAAAALIALVVIRVLAAARAQARYNRDRTRP